MNIDRDPRWGRSFEAYTEDPYLNAVIADADIKGVQSQKEMSQVKHFAVYNQETNRNTAADDAIVSERALHEIYLPRSGPRPSRPRELGDVRLQHDQRPGRLPEPGPAVDTLDQRWAYPGFVGSDYGGTHSTVASADGPGPGEPSPDSTARRCRRP